MAKARIKIKASPGASGTKLASAKLRVSKTGGQARVVGKPIYQTSVQLTTHINRGQRPARTEFRNSR